MEGRPLIRTERHRLTRMEGRHLINMGHHLNPTDGGRIHTTLVRGALSCYPRRCGGLTSSSAAFPIKAKTALAAATTDSLAGWQFVA